MRLPPNSGSPHILIHEKRLAAPDHILPSAAELQWLVGQAICERERLARRLGR